MPAPLKRKRVTTIVGVLFTKARHTLCSISTSNSVKVRFFIIMLTSLNIATWNVRGLTKEIKKEELVYDAKRYGFDLVSLQETKCYDYLEADLGDKYKLILFEQSDNFHHHGLGFLISPQLKESIISWHKISNRVAYINFKLRSKSGQLTYFRVINAYGPHMGIVKDDVNVSHQFYKDLSEALNIPARYDVFIAGDFNSRLGRRSIADVRAGLSHHIGNYGNGERNTNGQSLLDFMIQRDLYACNTCFKHRARHITSWTSTTNAKGDPSKTVKFYRQIDYILCKSNYKVNLSDARSYGGAKLSSDHKPVVARFLLHQKYLVHKKHKQAPKLDLNNLNNPILKNKMLITFENKVQSRINTENPNTEMNNLMTDVYQSAEDVLGTIPPKKHKNFSSDPDIYTMSQERKKLMILNNQTKEPTNRNEIKLRINQLKRMIRKRLKEITNSKADTLVQDINNTDDARRYYGAAKILSKGYDKKDITVENEKGEKAGTDDEKARIIMEYFKREFNDNNEPTLPAFLDPPSSLDTPISEKETERAISKLKSGKAVGLDRVPGEVVKALNTPAIHKLLAKSFNESFEKNIHIEAIGAGILTPLAKPGKHKGPVKSIRPLTLLNISRKILSLTVLHRIESPVDDFTGPFQAAYKAGRSCADLVWAQNMLISVVARKDFEFSKEVLLGTKLYSEVDINTRINKANTAFRNFDKLWCQGPKRSQITVENKLRLYESLVVSVLLYNSCCWAVPKDVFESVNVVQRKHLRRILNIYWPNTISNNALYERCKTRPLTERIEKSRWTMLGHVLRSNNDTPAYQSFLFAWSMLNRGSFYKDSFIREGLHVNKNKPTIRQ